MCFGLLDDMSANIGRNGRSRVDIVVLDGCVPFLELVLFFDTFDSCGCGWILGGEGKMLEVMNLKHLGEQKKMKFQHEVVEVQSIKKIK